MKTKYMMNWGFAFAEKFDIKRLEKKAANGWVLNKFTCGGFFYQLVQAPKQELNYTLDINASPDSEYFDIFKAAGWNHMASASNYFHMFSAPKDTAPIYSGDEVEEGKYQAITAMLGQGALYSGMILLLLLGLMLLSKSYLAVMFYPLLVLTLICSTAFVFCFMPFVALKYKNREKLDVPNN